MKWMVWILLAVGAGCRENGRALADLKAHAWELKAVVLDHVPVELPEQPLDLVFADSAVLYGSAGCNRFFGTYEAEAGGRMNLSLGGMTMMACPDQAFEERYLKALPEVCRYSVGTDTLKMADAAGRLTLVYGLPDRGERLVGVARDAHGCNRAAGYVWSEVRQDCIRVFEEGVRFAAVADRDTTLAAYVVFAADSLKAEAFLPGQDLPPVLERKACPPSGYVWEQAGQEELKLRKTDGKWLIEQNGKICYMEEK